MHIFKKVLIGVISLFLVVFIVYLFCQKPNIRPIKVQMKRLDLSNVNNVMIVGHPGEEALYGANHLFNDSYLVVCVTCTHDTENTLKNALEDSDDKLVSLGYADGMFWKRSNLENFSNSIKEKLKYILNYKDWNIVVTHNPDGEDGNLQDKIISNLVTSVSENELYYFGKFYEEDLVNNYEETLNEQELKNKLNHINKYYGDEFENLEYMLPYEDWVIKDKWQN